jgi:NAD(P)H-hydrate epimerase
MSRLVSDAEQLVADRKSETQYGFPPILLMEQAAARLWQALRIFQQQNPEGLWLILAGKGNNGGDAWALARYAFLQGCRVHVVSWGASSTENTRTMSHLASKLGIGFSSAESSTSVQMLAEATCVIDGIWGAGFRGPVRQTDLPLFSRWLEALAATDVPIVALDCPSGLWWGAPPESPVVKATHTLALGWGKVSCWQPLYREHCGDIGVLELGYPEAPLRAAELLEVATVRGSIPRLGPSAHKGTRGHVLVAGGALGMPGALVLAARAAAAVGAGLVSIYTDAAILPLVAPQVPAFQVRELTQEELGRVGVKSCVVGPGWGRGPERPEALLRLLGLRVPTVVDADGLGAWKSLRDANLLPSDATIILTPHPGEWLRLGGGNVDQASQTAQNLNTVIVLKNSVTWVLAPDGRRAVWDGRLPELGTGGSGDCLAGAIGGYLARGLQPFEAACAGVVSHGDCARELAQERGWFTAERLPDALALWESQSQKQKG